MVFNKIETKKQIIYTNKPVVNTNTASTTNTPLLSFNNTQNNWDLSIEHTTNQNQQYVQSYLNIKSKDGKTYNINEVLEKRINNVTATLQKAEEENGPIGKAWSWAKNTIGFGDSSDEVRELQANEKKLLVQFNANEKTRANVFMQLTGYEYTEENLEKFVNGQIKLKSEIAIEKYKEGQDMTVEITSDIFSGAVAYVAATACIAGGIAAAPFTAGASLGAVAVGVGIAAGAGAATKVVIKGGEALCGDKEYSLKQAGKDATIGLVSGALAPVTIGVGGAVTTSVGKVAPKFVATTARLSVDGATFGAADGAIRSALEGDSIGDVALNGLKGAGVGALAGNVLGHSGNALGKGAKIVYEKITPVHNGNGFTYRKNLLGHKYKLQLDKPDLGPLQFDLPSLKQPNPHPTNLTNELTRVPYYGKQAKNLLVNNPNLSPIVGSLPQKWGRKLAGKKGLEEVDKIFYNLSSLYYKGALTTTELNVAQTNLSKILNSKVIITELGSGNIGKTFTITVDNQSFVLKCFRPIERAEWQGIHGNYNELSMAVYVSKNDANNYAKFYMGRFGENNDGYILTKYIEGSHPSEKSVTNFSFKKHAHSTNSLDIKADNIKGTKQIDFGAITVNKIVDKFSAKEKNLLDKIAVALDDNNIQLIETIIKKEGNSQEFLNVKTYIQTLVNNYSAKPNYGINAGLTIEYFIERQSVLDKIGVECIPKIGVYQKSPERRYYPAAELRKYYGLSWEEWRKLFYGNE